MASAVDLGPDPVSRQDGDVRHAALSWWRTVTSVVALVTEPDRNAALTLRPWQPRRR